MPFRQAQCEPPQRRSKGDNALHPGKPSAWLRPARAERPCSFTIQALAGRGGGSGGLTEIEMGLTSVWSNLDSSTKRASHVRGGGGGTTEPVETQHVPAP